MRFICVQFSSRRGNYVAHMCHFNFNAICVEFSPQHHMCQFPKKPTGDKKYSHKICVFNYF
ncbi:MAG: hypothetical protein BWX91_00953 [Spirochaetes bacterium ADurb.Bin133]|nr:MAG: hypothetical protein BWX91_00953 [Spirochaetes bacterium ADurb.Bin133]